MSASATQGGHKEETTAAEYNGSPIWAAIKTEVSGEAKQTSSVYSAEINKWIKSTLRPHGAPYMALYLHIALPQTLSSLGFHISAAGH